MKFEVKDDHIGRGKGVLYAVRKRHSAASIQRDIDALLVQFLRQFAGKLALREDFTAAERHAALLAEIGLVARDLGGKLVRGRMHRPFALPSVGVVAIGAAKGAAHKKDLVAYPLSVEGGEALDGMDVAPARSVHQNFSWKVRLMTSCC